MSAIRYAPKAGAATRYLESVRKRGDASLLLNPHFVEAREQGLKDTYALFAVNWCADSQGRLPNGVQVLNFSSGNFPLYFPGRKIAPIQKALEEELARDAGYRQREYLARERVANYYGVNAKSVFFTNGISGGIEVVQELFLHGTKGRILMVNGSYPTHFSFAVTFGGSGLIETVERDPRTGQPDFSSYGKTNNPFQRVSTANFLPYGNPLPIVQRESVYRNDQGTGIFDLAEAATRRDGRLRPIQLDMIYSTFSWSDNSLTVNRLKELADERHILIFYNSLSKLAMEPGLRAGVVAVYVPPKMLQRIPSAAQIIQELNSKHDRLLCGTSRFGAQALAAAHDYVFDKNDPDAEAIVAEAKTRFIGLDGNSGNQATMLAVPYVVPMFPDLEVECSGYNVFKVKGEDLPWTRAEYKSQVLHRLEKMLDQIPSQQARMQARAIYDDYRLRISPNDIGASDIFCLDLLLETGVVFAPIERFYSLGKAPKDLVAFRPVMIAEPEEFAKAAGLLGDFLRHRLD